MNIEHINAIASLCGPKARADMLKTIRALKRLEREAHDAATAQCNGAPYGNQPYRDEGAFYKFENYVCQKLARILDWNRADDWPFKINTDPRGYALKVRSDYAPEGMHKDWGGYGILCP